MTGYMKGEVIGLIAGPMELDPIEVTGYAVIATHDRVCGKGHRSPAIKVISHNMDPDAILDLLTRAIAMMIAKRYGINLPDEH